MPIKKRAVREIYKRLINIKMKQTEGLVSYQGRAQKLKRLLDTNYTIKDIHKWGIPTKGLLDAYKKSLGMIN